KVVHQSIRIAAGSPLTPITNVGGRVMSSPKVSLSSKSVGSDPPVHASTLPSVPRLCHQISAIHASVRKKDAQASAPFHFLYKNSSLGKRANGSFPQSVLAHCLPRKKSTSAKASAGRRGSPRKKIGMLPKKYSAKSKSKRQWKIGAILTNP